MDRTARDTIRRLRERGFRVLFECNYDGTICVTGISATGETYIVHGRICDDRRAIAELAQMANLPVEPTVPGA